VKTAVAVAASVGWGEAMNIFSGVLRSVFWSSGWAVAAKTERYTSRN